tara:strand:- start:6209 stop:7324 length:1116 start_codon:yes stop_codon:yes gene_type:complete
MLFFPVANAGLVEVYMNGDDDDLVISEVDTTIPFGTDITLQFYIKGAYMFSDDPDDEEYSVHNINIDVEFLSNEDLRDACRACAAPRYIEPKDNEIRDYDVYEAKFYSDSVAQNIDGYVGDIRFNVVMSNKTSAIITGADTTISLTINEKSAGGETSSGLSLPEIPASIMDNLVLIIGGLVGVILLSFGIYTFVLAPEDTTASLYKTKESINPLSKSLTGVGYETDLPSESKLKRLEDSKIDSDEEEEDEEEDDDYEDYDDDEEEDPDFDESELLAKLTGGQTLKDTKNNDDEEPEVTPAPKKKPIKKTITKKGVAKKKVIRKAAPPKDVVPEVNVAKGMTVVTCPSCDKVHHIDENTPKFICSCGRRTRV